MVQLLLTSFPTPGTIERRTADADGGIPPQVAASGELHHALVDRRYSATPPGGNRYIRELETGDELVIDLLVQDQFSDGQPVTIGEFTLDSTPALLIPLSQDPIVIDVAALLTCGEELAFTTKVPTVEGAVILKSFAWQARREPRDAVDLYNLLLVAREHRTSIGEWQLDTAPLTGTRRDAARGIQSVARAARGPLLKTVINAARFVALSRDLVAEP